MCDSVKILASLTNARNVSNKCAHKVFTFRSQSALFVRDERDGYSITHGNEVDFDPHSLNNICS